MLTELCAQSRSDVGLVRCRSKSQTGTCRTCGRRLHTVRQISRSATNVDIVHKHAQLVLNTETNRQPVQLNQTWRNVVSIGRSSKISRAAAFCTRCRGSSVDRGRPAKDEFNLEVTRASTRRSAMSAPTRRQSWRIRRR